MGFEFYFTIPKSCESQLVTALGLGSLALNVAMPQTRTTTCSTNFTLLPAFRTVVSLVAGAIPGITVSISVTLLPVFPAVQGLQTQTLSHAKFTPIHQYTNGSCANAPPPPVLLAAQGLRAQTLAPATSKAMATWCAMTLAAMRTGPPTLPTCECPGVIDVCSARS
jgi:hypothetical protein